jgi:hypothetical protein
LLITGNQLSCELQSEDGRISIGGNIDQVILNALPLLREIMASRQTCRIISWVSLGLQRTEALKATGVTCKVDLMAALRARRNSQPPSKYWQMPGDEVVKAPAPLYLSWTDYLQRTTNSERMKRCYAAAKKANRKRLLSEAPKERLTGQAVWTVFESAKGRCAHCGSLAVESRPSDGRGAPVAWAQVGRRVGSLEHARARYAGGDNFLENLAWSCLWCNTWPAERRRGAMDHGGYFPIDADLKL